MHQDHGVYVLAPHRTPQSHTIGLSVVLMQPPCTERLA